MSWFAELAGKAETLLNSLDEQTGAALCTQNVKKKQNRNTYSPPPAQRNSPRPILRNSKKPTTVIETKSMFTTTTKSSPRPHNSATINKASHTERQPVKINKSKAKNQFNLDNCPKTLVNDPQGENDRDNSGVNWKRRFSLPTDLEGGTEKSESIVFSECLELENAILKQEIQAIHLQVNQLVNQLRIADDGNDVDEGKELNQTRLKLEDCERQNYSVNQEKSSMASQLLLLKEKIQEIAVLEQNYQGQTQNLISKNSLLSDTNHYLEEKLNELTKKLEESNLTQRKLESELRHGHSIISELKGNLEKSNAECQRLEKEWATYKLRVKSMLHAKDNEIKSLLDGVNLTEDTKELREQLDCLTKERDDLSEAVANVRKKSDAMKSALVQVENGHAAAKKVVAALRDALKDERSARNRAERELLVVNEELKNMQIETGQTIASLRTALRDKESELNHLRETSSIKTVDASSLNVADYGVTQETIDSEKIRYLTETLVQRQAKVDKLLAEKNMLRIQLDKLESKKKTEVSHRSHNNHSIVNIQGDHRMKRGSPDSLLTIISQRIAAVIRRHPVLRIFIIIYMICLHFWVVTVLLTNTPSENFFPKKK